MQRFQKRKSQIEQMTFYREPANATSIPFKRNVAQGWSTQYSQVISNSNKKMLV